MNFIVSICECLDQYISWRYIAIVMVVVFVAVFVVVVVAFVVFATNKYSWVREMSLVILIVKLLTIESARDEKHRKEGASVWTVTKRIKKIKIISFRTIIDCHWRWFPIFCLHFPGKGSKSFTFVFVHHKTMPKYAMNNDEHNDEI